MFNIGDLVEEDKKIAQCYALLPLNNSNIRTAIVSL